MSRASIILRSEEIHCRTVETMLLNKEVMHFCFLRRKEKQINNNIFRVFEKMRCVLLKLLRITVSAQNVLIVRRVLHAYARSFKL